MKSVSLLLNPLLPRPLNYSCYKNTGHGLVCTALLLLALSITSCGFSTQRQDSIADQFADLGVELVVDQTEELPEDFHQFLVNNNYHSEYNDLVYFLSSHGVENLVPTWRLLQQGSEWEKHALPRYAMPQRHLWEQMVGTLMFIKRELVPYIGPVKVLSGFRTPHYNFAAGGAGRSRHLIFSALDLRPVQQIDRASLHAILQNRRHNYGREYKLGMGLYHGTRFHIDTGGYRQW